MIQFMATNKKLRVAVIGSGHAALGACLELTKYTELQIDVIDIGLTSPYLSQIEKPVFNAKTYQGSFFPYGLNDHRWPVKLDSRRICSSHAYGGFSNVYSGAVLAPRSEDLVKWPKNSIPMTIDYCEVLRHVKVIGASDALERWSPLVPPETKYVHSKDSANQYQSVLGFSRIALQSSDEGGQSVPFNTGYTFDIFRCMHKIDYIGSTYVRSLILTPSGIQVWAICGGVEVCHGGYAAVFLAAGCVNTTGIAHRSCRPSSEGHYQLQSTSLFVQGFVGKGPKSTPELELRRRNSLPENFLEIRSADFAGHWSHTQISAVNRYVLATIAQRLPSVVIKKLSQVADKFYFAITNLPSVLNATSTIVCSPVGILSGSIISDQINVEETIPTSEVKWRRAVRSAIKDNLEQLNMAHIPGSEWLGNILRGNKLGGWHLGCTLPMTEKDDGSINCTPLGQLRSMPGVFVADSAAFPSIPGTTVALLTMAHAAKVARQWAESRVF